MDPGPWFEELNRIHAEVRRGQTALSQLEDWLRRNGVSSDVISARLPEEVSECIVSLGQALNSIRSAHILASDRYLARPFDKWFRGLQLTREEYHLFAASVGPFWTAKQVGLSDLDDYDVYCLFCYEDDERYAYINPDLEAPDSAADGAREGKTGMRQARQGRAPEELNIDGLREEQHRFFSQRLPEVYARFRRE